MRILVLACVLAFAAAPARADDEDANRLGEQGRKELIAGAVLLPLGVALVGGGAGMIISGICISFESSCDGKGNGGLVGAGAAFSAFGYASVIASIGLFAAGGYHKVAARRLLEAAHDPPEVHRDKLNARARTEGIVGWTFLGLGAAMAISSAALLSQQAGSSLAIGITLAPFAAIHTIVGISELAASAGNARRAQRVQLAVAPLVERQRTAGALAQLGFRF